MDFKEYLIKRNKTTTEKFLTLLLYIGATILAFVCLFLIPSLAGIGAFLAAGCYYGAFTLSSKFKREYEYIITDDVVDIDVIFNASRRERLISFSVKDVEILAPIKDSDNNARLKDTYVKTIDATTNRADAEIYFAVLEKGGRILVKFEPPYAALEILKKYAPSKVNI